MARTRPAGVSGVAVTFAALGASLVYFGIRDVPVTEGLRALLRGETPPSRSPGEPYTGPKRASAVPKGAAGLTGLPTGPVPQSETQLVSGIRVHRSIAANVAAMLTAAARDGIRLSGGGWRSHLAQRALRLAHGYTSDSMPSGAGGRLPVAIPGQSRHEWGLAIDFSVNGRSLERGDPAHTWLTQNAAEHGFHPLASEPWHWSTDGR